MFLAQKRGLMSFYHCADDIIDFKDCNIMSTHTENSELTKQIAQNMLNIRQNI